MLKFLMVGGAGVLVNSIALLVLHDLAHLPLILASGVAAELAIVNNFVWNDRWTFRHARRGAFLMRLVRFNLVALGGLGLATTTLWFLASYLGVPLLAGNLVGVAASTMWNFAGSRTFAWRQST
jgi:dolichol-phosphate mannosyltransferase